MICRTSKAVLLRFRASNSAAFTVSWRARRYFMGNGPRSDRTRTCHVGTRPLGVALFVGGDERFLDDGKSDNRTVRGPAMNKASRNVFARQGIEISRWMIA